MATSGSYSFGRTRDQIIKAAARKVSAIDPGEEPDADLVTDFAEALNAMVKHWQGQGIHIWRTAEGVLFPQLDQVRYTLSSSSTDHATESFVQTTISAAEASGQTVISVTSSSGMSVSDNIGIQVDDGTLHWTTISSIASNDVTIASGIDAAAAAGNLVFAYTTKLVRPLSILSARRFNAVSLLDTPISLYDRIEYEEFPNKTTEGTVNGIYYDRRGGANSSGLLYTWPEPDSTDELIKFTFARPIQDFSTSSDDPDLPQEWIEALTWNLARRMAGENEVSPQRFADIKEMAAQTLQEANWGERELVEFRFVPDMRR
jgi:hypothetical protein